MKVGIQHSLARGGWEIFIVDERAGGVRTSYKIEITERSPVPEGKVLEPAYVASDRMMQAFVPALKDALASAGFMADTGPLEGELKATKLHLDDVKDHYEDMRTIATRMINGVAPAREIKL